MRVPALKAVGFLQKVPSGIATQREERAVWRKVLLTIICPLAAAAGVRSAVTVVRKIKEKFCSPVQQASVTVAIAPGVRHASLTDRGEQSEPNWKRSNGKPCAVA